MFDGSQRVNPHDTLPRHAQVQKILRALIADGSLRPGDKIPAELHIASALGVSKMTVNKALLTLTQEGILVREVGRGTFIAGSDSQAGEAARPGADQEHRSASSLPRVALSFVEGARDVLGSDYYSGLYRGITDGFAIGTDTPKAEIYLLPPVRGDYTAEGSHNLDTTLLRADARLIIAPRAASLPSVDRLWEQGHACVVVGASWPLMGAPYVDSDNVGGAALAVRHLTQLGHRRIALLYAEPETANTQDRVLGYHRALSVADITHEPGYLIHAKEAWEIGDTARASLRALLTGPEPVTAIFAAGYYLGLEALALAHEIGLAVPAVVSVVAFDDPLGAHLAYPPLTTIRQPLEAMGFRAAERLLALLQDGARDISRDVLPAKLVIRQSTGPAAERG